MNRRILPWIAAAALAALALAATPTAPAASPPDATVVQVVPRDVVERVKAEGDLVPWAPGRDCPPEVMKAELEAPFETPKDPSILANGDNDGAHLARGSVLIINVFVNHSGGTWDAAERTAAMAKATNAADRYLSHAPGAANLHFSTEYFGSYINPTVGYAIPTDGMTWAMCEDALAAHGFADADGDGSRCDDATNSYKSWYGGWDYVILSFQPADITGRAYASFSYARCVNYTDDTYAVWWHEWGHIFGACDEYVEGGHCNSGIDCGACQSTYLLATVNNDNCDLAACPSDVDCVMRYNNDVVCAATRRHWAWVDEDLNGLLDDIRRRESGSTFRRVWELYHNGWYAWNNTSDAQSLSQYWNNWMVCGLRSPADTDYDLRLYQEDDHNVLLASSTYGGTVVDFVVADYNHTRLGNEHIQIEKFSGASSGYNIVYESGNNLLYPDGVERAGSWTDYNVVRVWDVPLFGGEIVTFTLDVVSGDLDLGMALYKSNGDVYYAGRVSAVFSRDAGGVGATETYTYTVPADDVYGLVVWSNSTVAGTFDIQIGPTPYTLAEESPFNSGLDLRLFNYDPNAAYWAFVGTRPDATANVSIHLYGDSQYQDFLDESGVYGLGSMEWIAVDYLHAPFGRDYLRVNRTDGTGNHRTMWEGDAEVIDDAFTSSTWTSPNLAKIWDTYVPNGEDHFYRMYTGSDTFDAALYLYSSASGDRYRPRSNFEVFSNQPPDVGDGEWLHFTSTVSDWYGLVMPVFDESFASYSIWNGPYKAMATGTMHAVPGYVLFGEAAATSSYWTVLAARPGAGGDANVWLYTDPAYTITSLKVDDQSGPGVRYVVGDYNHSPMGTIYPRYSRTLTTPVTAEFEGGANLLTYYAGSQVWYTITWPAGEVARAYDIYIPAGARVGFLAEVLSGDLDPGLELFDSNGAEYYARKGQGVDFSDASGPGGTESLYWVNGGAADYAGLVVFNNNAKGGQLRLRVVDAATVAVGDPAPVALALAPTPNPFAGGTTLRYALPREGDADLVVFDLQGRAVRTLVYGRIPAGRHEARWDGADDSGRPLASGVYLARLRAGGEERVVKMVRSR